MFRWCPAIIYQVDMGANDVDVYNDLPGWSSANEFPTSDGWRTLTKALVAIHDEAKKS